MEKRITKKERYLELKEIVEKLNRADKTELVEFLERQVELLDKKSKTKTKTQIENDNFKVAIVEGLREINKELTIAEIQENIPEVAELSNQRITALLTQLVTSNVVKRRVERQDKKRKVYFKIAEKED